MNTNRIADGQITEVSPTKTRRIIHTDKLMMAVWDFSDGPWENPEPYHSHPHDQIVYLAEGEVLFFRKKSPAAWSRVIRLQCLADRRIQCSC